MKYWKIKINAKLSLLCLLLLCACGSTEPTTPYTPAEICENVMNQAGLWEGTILSEESVTALYGIGREFYSSGAVFQAPNGIFPHEGFVFLAKDRAAAKKIASALENHRQQLMSQSREYDPAAYAVQEQCSVTVQGRCVSLFMSPLRELMESVCQSAFSEKGLPTLRPTPEPIPEPTPESTPEPVKGPVEDSWFDDVLLVGDSITNNLSGYVWRCRSQDWPSCMGNAILFTAGNFSYHLAVAPKRPQLFFPIFQGIARTVEGMVSMVKPGKLMVCMGMNDIALLGIDQTMENVDTLMGLCLDAKPDLKVILMGMTPRMAGFDYTDLPNSLILEFNERLRLYAEDRGFYYLDSFEALADENGCLRFEHCSDPYDMGLHPNYEACALWLDYIYEHCGELNIR